MLLFTCALLCVPGVVGPTAKVAPSETYAIRARAIHVGGGETIENGLIVIENGKIRAVGKNLSVPEGTPVIEHDGAVSAGLIALHGYAGTKLPAGQQTVTFNIFGQGEVAGPEGWRRHVHGHVELEDPAEEVVVDRGEEVPEDEATDAGKTAHGGADLGHEHGGDVEDDPADLPAPILESGLYAAREGLVDTTRTVMPDAETVHAFNPDSGDFRHALEAGITTLVLTPDPQSLVPGQTAVVKTSGRVLEPKAHLSLGFRADALPSDRYPTSFGGAVAELDRRFTEPKGAFERAATGKLPVLFEVSDRQDVLRAAEFAKRHELKGAICGADRVGEVAEAVKAANLAAIVGPFPIGVNGRALRSVVQLAKAGVPFGFGLDAPLHDPASLRFSAASCVGQGLDRAVAWSALTDTAARIAGVERKVGRLAAGFDADLVLWSGDPLDLASRPETVIVDGRIVVGGAR